MKSNCTEERRNLKGGPCWPAPSIMYLEKGLPASPYSVTLHWVKFGGGNSSYRTNRTNQDNLRGMYLLWKTCHPWCDLIQLSYSDKVHAENPCMCFPGAAGVTWLCFHMYWWHVIKGNYIHWLLHGQIGNEARASSQHQQVLSPV